MTRIIIPQLDANLVDVTITRWEKKPGERVEKGEAIAELTTDKAVYELEAPEDGELLRILAPEKSVVPTGYIVALSGTAGEEDNQAEIENERLMTLYRGDSGNNASAEKSVRKERVRATPKARRMARKKGVTLEEIQKKSGVDVVDEETVNRFFDNP